MRIETSSPLPIAPVTNNIMHRLDDVLDRLNALLGEASDLLRSTQERDLHELAKLYRQMVASLWQTGGTQLLMKGTGGLAAILAQAPGQFQPFFEQAARVLPSVETATDTASQVRKTRLEGDKQFLDFHTRQDDSLVQSLERIAQTLENMSQRLDMQKSRGSV